MDINEIAKRIRQTIVSHPYYNLTFRRIFNHCGIAQPGTAITLVGPTRVGKTMLSHKLAKALIGEDVHPEQRPLIRVEAAATDGGFISSRYMTLQMLTAVGHPFHGMGSYEIRAKDSESHIRRQLVSGLEYRGTKFIVIDEAHHLLRTKSNHKAEGVLDSMKCLGNEAKCVVVFIGGYEILRHQFRSAHLNGRLLTVEFSNYGVDEEGYELFSRLLATVDAMLPWARGQTLLAHREMIYRGTSGCYGQLVHWTLGALAEMAARGESALRKSHFLETRKEVQVDVIRQDIEEGKRMLAGLPPSPRAPDEARPTGKRARRPFQRRPKRDPVGGGSDS
ncbi:TniB family NTP-binding protein [Frateuria terrea]|uniref:AAA domain-containing protein n=1 Tax=Frateuria terrea TaxID=529704 RepID=A0A1H6SHK8_9GAMM|nr:TniB family NTP-binding protein [Frateuria terrea]SEI67371.1 AAA domain-containing protein [Frateuria terrea]SFP26564.1 AAA domain-containing protein [Frateuria terrea]